MKVSDQNIKNHIREAIEKVYKDHESVEIKFSLEPTDSNRPEEIIINYLIRLNCGINIMYVQYINKEGWEFCHCDNFYQIDYHQCFDQMMNMYYDISKVIKKYTKTNNNDDIWSIKI